MAPSPEPRPSSADGGAAAASPAAAATAGSPAIDRQRRPSSWCPRRRYTALARCARRSGRARARAAPPRRRRARRGDASGLAVEQDRRAGRRRLKSTGGPAPGAPSSTYCAERLAGVDGDGNDARLAAGGSSMTCGPGETDSASGVTPLTWPSIFTCAPIGLRFRHVARRVPFAQQARPVVGHADEPALAAATTDNSQRGDAPARGHAVATTRVPPAAPRLRATARAAPPRRSHVGSFGN